MFSFSFGSAEQGFYWELPRLKQKLLNSLIQPSCLPLKSEKCQTFILNKSFNLIRSVWVFVVVFTFTVGKI